MYKIVDSCVFSPVWHLWEIKEFVFLLVKLAYVELSESALLNEEKALFESTKTDTADLFAGIIYHTLNQSRNNTDFICTWG